MSPARTASRLSSPQGSAIDRYSVLVRESVHVSGHFLHGLRYGFPYPAKVGYPHWPGAPAAGTVDSNDGVERSGDNDESEHRRARGRWSADHWKTAVAGWLAFCVVAVALGAVAGTKMLKHADTAAGGHAEGRADARRRRTSRAARRERARPSRRRRRSSDPAFRAAVADVVRTVSKRLPDVQSGSLAARARRTRGQISEDRRSAVLVQFKIAGDEDKADEKVAADPRRGRRRAGRATPRFTVAEFGFASANHELERHAEQGLPARRVLVAAGDAADPARRVRRARRGRAAGAARVLGRARDDRALGAREPRRRRPATRRSP